MFTDWLLRNRDSSRSMPSGSRHTLQVSRLASQPVLQWLGSVNVEACHLSVGALEPARPGNVNLISSTVRHEDED